MMQTQYLQRMLIGLGLVMALAVPWASASTNYYVVAPGQSTPTPPWTNWGLAHTNLFEVVAVARDNDTVYMTNNAKYYLTNQITLNYAIMVRSWGPGGILDPINTIIDANIPGAATTNRHFSLNNYGATLAGLTLTNGWDTSYATNVASGGAILIYYGIVTNCIIMRNYAMNPHSDYNRAGGGGIYMGVNTANSGGVWNCTVSGNSAYQSGGGISVFRGGPWKIMNCTVSGNSARGKSNSGGGIYLNPVDLTSTIISNCWVISNYCIWYSGGVFLNYTAQCHDSVIIGNTAEFYEGGGIRMGANSLVRNCLIANNLCLSNTADGGGIAISGRALIQNCTIVSNTSTARTGGVRATQATKIENSIIWGNSGSGSYSNWYIYPSTNPAASGWGGYTTNTFTNCCTSPQIVDVCAAEVNTITNDPRFVNNVTDFRLQSGSPCINAGVNREWMENALDVYGNRRIDNFRKTVDIGAYEYLSRGTLFGFQ
ncbi:MAG: hypothetical protein NT011_13815 [Kiritimatiellaeota bacterium]|nr:hypothetical protein [Kiritimatiellota bacterium]